MTEVTYSPAEIVFSHKTALWVIQNLGSLQAGYWPLEESGYVDSPGKRAISSQASFITPIECAAEMTSRLERCGIDGLILLAIECWGISVDSLAKYFKMPAWSVRKRRRRALSYVASGPARRWHDIKKRRGETYQEFKATWGKKK